MIKKLIRFVLVLALGIAIGYVLHPTIEKKLDGTGVGNVLDSASEEANPTVDSLINK